MAGSPVQPGEVVAGKYLVERLLGEGGMGCVVEAKHEGLNEPVALKFLHSELAGREESVERFRREARAAAKIKNRHIGRVYDVGELDDGTPYMVLEYLRGNDLAGELAKRRSLEIDEALVWMLQACGGVAAAHRAGIVHRDLKPANLFLDTRPDGDRIVKVLDFGISKSLSNTTGEMGLTKTSALIGSPLYMSPEQMDSARHVDERTDIYALGAILFEMLAGRAPFLGQSLPQLCRAVIQDDVPPLDDFRAGVPPEIETAIRRCLAKKPEDRFHTVEQFAEALKPFASEQPQFEQSVDVSFDVTGAGALDATVSEASYSGAISQPGDATLGAWGRTGEPPLAAQSNRLYLGAVGGLFAIGAIAAAVALWSRDDDATPEPATLPAQAATPPVVAPTESAAEPPEPSPSAVEPSPSAVETEPVKPQLDVAAPIGKATSEIRPSPRPQRSRPVKKAKKNAPTDFGGRQ